MKFKHVCLLIFTIIVSSIEVFGQRIETKYDSILNDTKRTPHEILDDFQNQYNQAKISNDQQEQFNLAKYISRSNYRLSKTKDLKIWMNRVDSLEQTIENSAYDRGYEMLKITYANAQKNNAEAIRLLEEMEPLVLSSTDTIWKIDYYMRMVSSYAAFDDLAVALKNLYEAEKLNEQFQGLHQWGLIANAKSTISWEKRNIEDTYTHQMEAIKYFEEAGSTYMLASSYANAITKAKELNKNDDVEVLMEKLNNTHKKLGCRACYYSGELNRVLYFIQASRYDEAIALADKTIAFADSMDRDKSHALYLKGVAYRGLDIYKLAERYIEQAFDIGKQLQHKGKCAFYSHALYQTYYWKDKFEPALEWYEIHTTYKDSVYNEKKATEIAVYESKLESLEQKRKVTELEAKVKIDKQRKRLLWVIICFGAILSMLFLYAQRQRSRKKQAIQDALLAQANAEKELLQNQLEFKQKELAGQILSITQKNNLLQELHMRIKDLKNQDNAHSITRLLRTIQRNIENADEWDKFLQTFKSIHNSFLDKLQQLAQNLTSNEVRLASLIKMNLTSKEIAGMLNISDDGVKKARYRLRKKLGLASEVNIQDFLLGLG